MTQQFACVILVDRRGWLLLQERDEHPVIDPELWGFVGGHVDPGEEPDDAAYRELEEETGISLEPPALPRWGVFEVFHPAYDSLDEAYVYTARTELTDADIVCGEGRQIVFVDPAKVGELPQTGSVRRILPEFLASERYQELCR